MSPRFTIRDETVHAAFDTLEGNVSSASNARAMRERREDERKAVKARAFLDGSGSVADREAAAILTDDYKVASQRYYEAVEADEYYRAERSKCEAVIEAWRTCQSNFRAMAKVS